MSEKEEVELELKKLMDIREEFLKYFDENLPKDKSGYSFDFSSNPQLNAKEVYKNFFKLDYQARKLRGYLVKAYDLKP